MNGRSWTLVALLAAALSGCRSGGGQPQSTGRPGEAKAGLSPAQGQPPKRLVYPWSVVAGGVDTPVAMRRAMEEDPVVQSHYADLDPSRFRTETLPAKRQAHVSYRVGDKIFWTRRPVTLQAGETVLTDGSAMLRGRCGNRISVAPRQPVAPAGIEPEEIAMDRPAIAMQTPPAPAFPAGAPVVTSKFSNPMQPAEESALTSYLPPPDALDPLPPVWVNGGGSNSGGGFVGAGSTSGGAGSANSPITNPTAPPVAPPSPLPAAPPLVSSTPGGPVSPVIPTIPVAAAGTPDPPPPLVLISLLTLPAANTSLPIPVFPGSGTPVPPTLLYPPLLTTAAPTPPSASVPPDPSPPPPAPGPPGGTSTPLPPFSQPPIDPLAPPPQSTQIPEPGTGIFVLLGMLGVLAGLIGRRI